MRSSVRLRHSTVMFRSLEAEYTFIQKRFHPMTFSSKNGFIQSTFIQHFFHKASRPIGLCPPFGFQQAFMWSIAGRRPKAGDAPHEGLKVQSGGLGVECLGVWGFGV